MHLFVYLLNLVLTPSCGIDLHASGLGAGLCPAPQETEQQFLRLFQTIFDFSLKNHICLRWRSFQKVFEKFLKHLGKFQRTVSKNKRSVFRAFA